MVEAVEPKPSVSSQNFFFVIMHFSVVFLSRKAINVEEWQSWVFCFHRGLFIYLLTHKLTVRSLFIASKLLQKPTNWLQLSFVVFWCFKFCDHRYPEIIWILKPRGNIYLKWRLVWLWTTLIAPVSKWAAAASDPAETPRLKEHEHAWTCTVFQTKGKLQHTQLK